METASFSGLLKTIFYIVLFYYIFRFAMRLLLPMLLRKAVEKAEENMRRQAGDRGPFENDPRRMQPEKPRGQSTGEQAKETGKVGEYIDFEEIE
jgi:hypothetical protein